MKNAGIRQEPGRSVVQLHSEENPIYNQRGENVDISVILSEMYPINRKLIIAFISPTEISKCFFSTNMHLQCI